LPDEAAARAFAQRIAGGMTFAQAATQAGFSPSDVSLGDQTREQLTQLTSQAVASAAFSAAEGAVTPPTRSPLGWHIVHVDGITRSEATPLAAARDEIAGSLAAQKREQALADLVTRVEDRLAEGATLDEVAQAESLEVRETPPVTASGVQFDNPGFQAPELQPALATAFDMGVDEDPLVETLEAGQRFVIVDVAQVVPAAPPPLAEVQDRVKADLIQRRALERARAVAASIVAKINGGTSPTQAFAEAKPSLGAPESVTARRIDIARPNQPVPPPLAMMFTITEGKAHLLAAPNGQGWFVVYLKDAVPGDASKTPGLIQATRTQFEGILGEEYGEQFGRSIEAGLDIERHEDAIERLKQQLAGPGAQ
jgi:peptidyl-prolyl cis-trans isomerase D